MQARTYPDHAINKSAQADMPLQTRPALPYANASINTNMDLAVTEQQCTAHLKPTVCAITPSCVPTTPPQCVPLRTPTEHEAL